MNGTMESSKSPREPSVREIFLEALSKAGAAERDTWLDSVCLCNPELRARVDALLRSHREDGFLERPAIHLEAPVLSHNTSLASETIGTHFDCYKLLEKIGEGGMGVVYLAEQDQPVRRKVALKIIKLGMDTRQVVARFEAERQALALMDHPHIAKVLDGGATESGRPYFVMELVRGVPITEFCVANQLSIEARIKLFIPVCHAIQSAHQKGIIHRDLKPSNVLVTLNAEVPHPMVIDFGVAKAMNQKLTEKTLSTNFATMIGTPAYMSPEQAGMSKLDVDTRSDIYSLGVLLYELLTGSTPFPEERLLSLAYREMQRIIVEEEPERPSTRLKKKGLTGSATPLATRHSSLATDLDWIVMKCLEKDRSRRYETANGLAADIQRYLNTEPIIARPPSAAYRVQKFVRRNKLQVTAAAAVALALLLGTFISAWQAHRAASERTRAERQLEAMLQLTKDAFQNVLPELGDLPGGAKPREALARAAERIIKELRLDPKLSPERRRIIGSFYLQLSYAQAWLGYNGNTTGQFEEGLISARDAIDFLKPSATEQVSDSDLYWLSRAEMSACFASMGLLRFEEAMGHARRMDEWAGLLGHRTNQWAADKGRTQRTWSRQLTAMILIRSGRSQQALDNFLGCSLNELEERAADREHASYNELWDLDGELELLGLAHMELGHKNDAARYRRERLQITELGHKRWPGSAGWNGNLTEARADMGETLLALGKPDDALPFIQAASQLAESLAQVDSRSPGSVMLKVRILRSHASGYIGWAEERADSAAERLRRLDQAQDFLNQAETLVAGLNSESLLKYLRHDLTRVSDQLQRLKNERETRPEN